MAKIKIQTTRFGEVEIDSDSVINIGDGLIGFPEFHTYTVIEYKAPFSWLQSMDDPSLAFLIIDSLELGNNFKMTREEAAKLVGLEKDDSHVTVLLVALGDNPKDVTVNLRAPVVINLTSKRGVQCIIDDESLSTRADLWVLVK